MQNIIWDWTGVIKDALHDHHKVVSLMFKEFGVPVISIEKLKATWKQPYMDFYKEYVPNLTMQRQKKAYFKAFAQFDDAKAYPGIVPLIKNLSSQNYRMFILSSDSPKSILKEIQEFDLVGIFEDMDLEVHDKVNHIGNLIKRNNIETEKTVIIGDTNNEIEAGKSVGVKTIAVTWGLCSEDNLKKHNPDYLVRNLQNLKKILM